MSDMQRIQLRIMGISAGHSATSYTLILEEIGGIRKLPIIIGAFEAQAIAIEIEKITPVRPMTHDLFKTLADDFDVTIREVLIHKLYDGVFYSNIVCSNGYAEHEIDARTSDAIALAVRFDCPIYTYENIMEEAALEMTENAATPSTPKATKKEAPIKQSKSLTDLTIEELNAMLDEAIENEDYVKAAEIRDELGRRTK